jgi:hypothetical protein
MKILKFSWTTFSFGLSKSSISAIISIDEYAKKHKQFPTGKVSMGEA